MTIDQASLSQDIIDKRHSSEPPRVTAAGFERENYVTTMIPQSAPVTGDETVPPAPGELIFARLAARWKAEGRVVPGQVDGEWVKLAGSCPLPTLGPAWCGCLRPVPAPAVPAGSLDGLPGQRGCWTGWSGWAPPSPAALTRCLFGRRLAQELHLGVVELPKKYGIWHAFTLTEDVSVSCAAMF